MSIAEKLDDPDSPVPGSTIRPSILSRQMITDLASLLDGLTVFAAGCLAHAFYFSIIGPASWNLSISASMLGAIGVVILFRRQDLYQPILLLRWWESVGKLGLTWLIIFFCLTALGFLFKVSEIYSRGWALSWFAFTVIGLVLEKAAVAGIIQRAARQETLHRRVAVVGGGEQGQRFIDRITAESSFMQLVGVFDDGDDLAWADDNAVPKTGSLDDLANLALSERIDDIVIAFPHGDEDAIWRVADKFSSLPAHIHLAPDVFDAEMNHLREDRIGPVRTSVLLAPPLSGWDRIVKGAEDRLLGLLFLLFFAPTIALLVLAIRLDTKGPAFFVQKRHGFNHEIIPVIKFRTMCVLEDGEEICQATRHDVRVTRVGRLLRRSSLDELPQLINVVRGEMSLVGPRPHAIAHNEKYAAMINSYSKRHRVKPGITGWAQINGYRGETKELSLMEKRIEYDLHYVENWSLWFDLKIILLTPVRGLIHPNAY